jgi:tRNA (guanine-N7-)-methyltransferase
MGRKNKLMKFAEMRSFPNFYQNFDFKNPTLFGHDDQVVDFKGKWNSDYFQNDNPITLELACGGGEYTVGLAQMYPHRNFIGIDVKGARIYRGAKEAMELGLDNVAFLRTRIELLEQYFSSEEIQEIWITFPDPFLKETRENKRLTSLPFLHLYSKIMKPLGLLNLKTDEDNLYKYTCKTVDSAPNWGLVYQHQDIYNDTLLLPELELKTYYESIHLMMGKSIKFVRARYCPSD